MVNHPRRELKREPRNVRGVVDAYHATRFFGILYCATMHKYSNPCTLCCNGPQMPYHYPHHSSMKHVIGRAIRVSLCLIVCLLSVGCGQTRFFNPNPQSDLSPVTIEGAQLMVDDKPFVIRGVNFLRPTADDPERCPRLQFGADGNCPWNLADIRSDLDRLQALEINAVRLFLNFYVFGGARLADPNYSMAQALAYLDIFIDEANQRGIYVMPVLLAKYPQDRFTPDNYEMMLDLHVRPVVQHLAGRPGILAWDLFNEPDIGSPVDIRCWDWDNGDFPLCFPLANERKHFIRVLHDEVKRLDPQRPTTVGLAFAKNYFEPTGTDLRLADVVDFYSFHYYDNDPYDSGRYAAHWYYGQGFPQDLRHAINELGALQPDRPIVITELGFPTGAGAERTLDDLQHDLRAAWQITRAEQISGVMLWPFQDQPEELVGDLFSNQ